MMNIVQHQVFGRKYGYGKLLLKTTSTAVNWEINKIEVSQPTAYTIVDNITGDIVKQDVFTGYSNKPNADLSTTSGDCSMYVDLEDNDTTCTYFQVYGITKAYFIDFTVIPSIAVLWLQNNGGTQCISSLFSELVNISTYGGVWNGLDFSNTTKLKSVNYRYNMSFDIPFDISNNPDLEKFYSRMSLPINFNNHLKLQRLHLTENNLDINVNNTLLPDLVYLNTYYSAAMDYDFNIRNLNKITTLSINANTISNVSSLTNLISFSIKKCTSTLLDLKGLLNLTKFYLNYNSSIVDILIDNGLNTQITKFERKYDTHTIDVKVDNPTDANAGVSPYLPTIWKEYNGNNSWNFI